MCSEREHPPAAPAPAPDRPLSRRQLLGLGVVAAAAAFSLEGCDVTASAGETAHAASRRAPSVSLPKLASKAMTPSGEVYQFRSRPDLSPPAVRIDINEPGQVDGLIFMDSQGGVGNEGPMIIDGSGELVWFRQVSASPHSPKRAFNLRVQHWQGKPALTYFDGSVVADHGAGEDVILDTSYHEIARVRAGQGYTDDLHAFRLTPHGTALITAYGIATADLRAYGGKANGIYVYGVAQEIEIATGKVVFEWRSDHHVPLEETYARVGKGALDYFHINAVDYTHDGNLLISARNTWTVYKVERTTGQVLWRLGGKKGEFSLGPGAHFAWQHDANLHPGNVLTVFDNGAGDYRTEKVSRGLVISVDEQARHATLQHQYLHPHFPLQAGALGSVQLLAGGQAFIGWGLLAGFTEYGADGKPLLDGRLSGRDAQSYRAFRLPWTGIPTDPPTATADRHGGTAVVYATWNGATQVSEWLVLGGAHPSSLATIGTAAKAGFETVITVPNAPPHLAVVALDADGHRLARSKVTTA